MTRPPRAWQRTAKPCSPSTISPPNIGNICGPRTRSRALSPPCGTAPSGRRAACRTRRRSRWCSSWSTPRRKAGAGSMATTSCPSSFKVSGSPTGSRSSPTRHPRNPKPPPPEPSGHHQNSAIALAHSGPVAKGSFVQTLTLTDIATGWTECAPLLVREQTLLTEVLSEMRRRMPSPLLGFDTDNDSVFMNETVRTYCVEAGLVFTRCRPYRKNDQAWVEQKNGAVVRRVVGYRRYEGLEAAALLGQLYAALRLFVNFPAV